MNKRHDLYLIAALWVVATQVRASLTLSTYFRCFKRKRGKSERHSFAGCERVQALAVEKRRKMWGESDKGEEATRHVCEALHS
jgi:hypothetical protein